MTNLIMNQTAEAVLNLFPAHKAESMKALKASIERIGQLMPILVKGDTIVDGRARLQICRELGRPPIFEDIGDAANEAEYAKSVNLHRRDLTTWDKASIADKLASMPKGANQHTAEAACSRQEAADMVGISPDSIDRYRTIKNKGCPEIIEKVSKGEISMSAAARLVKARPIHADQERVIEYGLLRLKKEVYLKDVVDVKRVKAQKLAKNNAKALKVLSGIYSVIYADPAWLYPGQSKGSFCDPEAHYPVMTTQEIMELPVEKCLTPDAAIFLWVPSCLLEDGIAVLKAWGFFYVNTMVWIKDRSLPAGGATKTAHELLLIGRRGNKALHEAEESLNSWIEAPTSDHSRKPEIFAEMIDKLYPGFPKLEMFGRKPRSNEWTVFGNEVVEEGSEEVTDVVDAAVEATVPEVATVAESSQATVLQQLFAANDPRSKVAA